MKTFILMAVIAIQSVCVAHAGDPVNKLVWQSFTANFPSATSVSYEQQRLFVKVTFVQNEQKMIAYYNDNAELTALGRMIGLQQLPLLAANNLNSMIGEKWLTELFELSVDGETSYYATLRDGNRTTVMRAESSGNWSVFSRSRVPGK